MIAANYDEEVIGNLITQIINVMTEFDMKSEEVFGLKREIELMVAKLSTA